MHLFSPAFIEREFDKVLTYSQHLVFNSPTQWLRFKARAIQGNKDCGLRIHPEFSTQAVEHVIYDSAASGSRLVTTLSALTELLQDNPSAFIGISDLHFHILCEQNSDYLAKTLQAEEEKFGAYLYQMKWLNFGGSNHITREEYDLDLLVSEINRIKKKYDLQVYLEPGEAVVLNTGFLVAELLDFVENGGIVNAIDAFCGWQWTCQREIIYLSVRRSVVLGWRCH